MPDRFKRFGSCLRAASCLLPLVFLAPSSPSHAEVAVGFRIHQWTDATRSFHTWPSGNPSPGLYRGRPIRVFEWYPATKSPGESVGHRRPVLWRDYVVLEGDDGYVDGVTLSDEKRRALTEQYRMRTMRRYDLSAEEVDRLLDMPVGPVFDLPTATGRHPVLVMRTMPRGLGLIAAGLAARGYVVLAPSHLARYTRRHLEFTPNPDSLATDIRDLQFVAAKAAEIPHVDGARLAAMGFSSGSLPPLLWQMQDLRAGALVAIEGWEGFLKGVETLEGSPDYRPRAIRVPHLLIEKAAEENNEAYAKSRRVFDAMEFATRERVTFADASHFSFLSEPRLVADLERDTPTEDASASESTRQIHDAALDVVLEFLNRHLLDHPRDSRDHGPRPYTRTVQESQPAFPTDAEWARLFERGDFENARALLRSAEEQGLTRSVMERGPLRRVAGELVDPEQRRQAYELIAIANPGSTWAWIELGNAWGDVNDVERKQKAFRKALERLDLDPSIAEDKRGDLRDEIEKEILAGAETP